MNKLCVLLILLLPTWLHGATLTDQRALVTWLLFPGGVQATNGSTITIVANGVNREISLNGRWPDDKQGKQILSTLIAGKRSEVRIYGKDKDCRTVAALFVDGVNINEYMERYGFKQLPLIRDQNDCRADLVRISGIDLGDATTGHKDISYSPNLRSSNQNSTSTRGKKESDRSRRTVSVRAYTRKDGTRVRAHTRSPRGTLSK